MLRDVGPETSALVATRRWSAVGFATTAILSSVLLGVSQWSRLVTLERIAIVLAVLLLGCHVFLSRRPGVLWAAPLAGLSLISVALLNTPGSPAWITVPNIVGTWGYITVVLVSRRMGLLTISIGALLLAALWLRNPSTIVTWAPPGPMRWVAFAQVLAAYASLWWAWNLLVAETRRSDRGFAEMQRATNAAIARQVRVRAWRSELVHVHESVLNGIRYVLSGERIDGQRLSGVLAMDSEGLQSVAESTTIEALVATVQKDCVMIDLSVRGPLPALTVTPQVFDALRACSVELVRNSVLHGGATSVTVTIEQVGSRLLLVVADNGTGMRRESEPGIGMSTVLGDALADVGGNWRIEPIDTGTEVRIEVPVDWDGPERDALPVVHAFSAARLIVSAPLIGTAAVGLVFFAILASRGSLWLGGAALVGTYVLVLAMRHVYLRIPISAPITATLAMALILVPVFLALSGPVCADVSILSPVVNVTACLAPIVAVWGSLRVALVALVPWALAQVFLLQAVDPVCAAPVRLAVANAALIFPVIVLTTYVGVRIFRRAQMRIRESAKREVVERSRASALEDFAGYVNSAVSDALSILRRVAAGAPVDSEMQQQLSLVDARIRAGIQVDPALSGSFALLGKRLVERALDVGIALDVRALGPVADFRDLPDGLEESLLEALESSRGASACLQAFTDGAHDYLALSLTRHVECEPLLSGAARMDFEDTTLEVMSEVDEAASRTASTLLVTRPVATVSGLRVTV